VQRFGHRGSRRPEQQLEELSNQGLRVLAAAARAVDAGKGDLGVDDLESDMVFLGLVGIIDPPRPEAIEAIEAIKACHQAGIRVKMITGDHAGTAKSIGHEMGIGDGEHAITGTELETASYEDLRQLVRDNDIFARTSPEHKLRLVQALQTNGDVVAMTGDGVNDAPALKRADVGVAMGIKGTEATREAADIVLADDNFASIERAIEEGRTIYDNLRKSILFILPTNGAEALVVLIAVVFGLVLPLTPVQILWVNMVTAVTLAMALAFEPAEPGVMRRPPRDPRAPMLGGAFLWRIGFVSVLIGGATIVVFLIEQRLGMSVELARTMAVNTFVCGQVFYLFNSRFLRESSLSFARLFTNRAVWMAVGVLAVLQLMFVYAPFMHRLFGSSALDLRQWLVPLGIGLSVFLLVEAEKAIFRRFGAAEKHLAEHVTRVEVHLSDENGEKTGGRDKRCMMEARLEGHQPIAVTDEADSLDGAIVGAADKLKSSVDHTLSRLNHVSRSRNGAANERADGTDARIPRR
jgi:magnesium-transporting ATPase (P-type)